MVYSLAGQCAAPSSFSILVGNGYVFTSLLKRCDRGVRGGCVCVCGGGGWGGGKIW